MNRVVRDSGSNALSARARSWYFPVPVGEHGEQVEVQPVVAGFVEGLEDARPVHIPAGPLQQGVGLFPSVAPEVRVKQIDHGPEVPPLLHVDLKQIPQVVEAGRGSAELALLLHAGRLGVSLGHDEPPEVGPEFAGHPLPHGTAGQVSEADAAVLHRWGQEDPPAVLGHPHEVEMGTTRRVPTEMAVRRSTSLPWKPSGPISFHHSRNAGCQRSSARWRRRSPERPTLLGIRESRLGHRTGQPP